MPDPNNPREVILRELHRIIGFDYTTTDMQAVRAALIKYAHDEHEYQKRERERDEPRL